MSSLCYRLKADFNGQTEMEIVAMAQGGNNSVQQPRRLSMSCCVKSGPWAASAPAALTANVSSAPHPQIAGLSP
jgi:hypothetical protein